MEETSLNTVDQNFDLHLLTHQNAKCAHTMVWCPNGERMQYVGGTVALRGLRDIQHVDHIVKHTAVTFIPICLFVCLFPKTLIEIPVVLSTNSGSFPSNSHVSVWLRFGGLWNPTNCEKFNADGSLMGRTNLDKSA